MTNVSGFQLVAALAGALAWPVAVVIAVIVLRRPLASTLRRVRRVEGLGIVAELAEIEHAKQGVQEELAEPYTPDVDELVRRAAELGWRLGRAAPNIPPHVEIDRSGGTPVVRSVAADAVRQYVDAVTLSDAAPISTSHMESWYRRLLAEDPNRNNKQ